MLIINQKTWKALGFTCKFQTFLHSPAASKNIARQVSIFISFLILIVMCICGFKCMLCKSVCHLHPIPNPTCHNAYNGCDGEHMYKRGMQYSHQFNSCAATCIYFNLPTVMCEKSYSICTKWCSHLVTFWKWINRLLLTLYKGKGRSQVALAAKSMPLFSDVLTGGTGGGGSSRLPLFAMQFHFAMRMGGNTGMRWLRDN